MERPTWVHGTVQETIYRANDLGFTTRYIEGESLLITAPNGDVVWAQEPYRHHSVDYVEEV